MEIRIEGHGVPGRDLSDDGIDRDNVHVGVQIGKEPSRVANGRPRRARVRAPAIAWRRTATP